MPVLPTLLLLLALPAAAAAGPPAKNASSQEAGVGVSFQNETFCQIIAADLPASCNCTDKPLGGSVNCSRHMFKADRIGLTVEVAPCDDVAHVDIAVTEAEHNISYELAGIKAGEDERYPIPGASVDIPKVGDVGLDLTVEVDGSLDMLTLKVGLDACGEVLGHSVCGSDLTKHLPFWVLHGSYAFRGLCGPDLRRAARGAPGGTPLLVV